MRAGGRTTWLPLVAGVLLSGLAAYVGWTLGASDGPAQEEAASTPSEGLSAAILTEFRLPSLSGGEMGPADFRGEVIVVDFWATWCSPCRVQARILDSIRGDYEDQGVQFMAISLGEAEETVRKFAEANPFPYPVLYDTPDRIASEASIYALPTVMIIDREGEVSYLQSGLSDAKTLREELNRVTL